MTNRQTQQTRKRNSRKRDDARKQQRSLKQSGFQFADMLDPAQIDALKQVVRK